MLPLPESKPPTPEEYLGTMRKEQGERPSAWARTLAQVVILDILPEEKAGAYAEALAGASGEQAQEFWDIYNNAIERWKKE